MTGSDSMRLQHLTLATNLTARSDRAFDRAVYLARQWNARLLVVHAVEEGKPSVTDEPSWRRGADQVLAARLKLQFEYPRLEQVDSAIEVANGNPYDLISQAAEREQTGLIITGVAGENPYGADDLGTLVPALAKSAPSPVLVVKKRLVTAPRRVVVASDLTDTSHSALRLALDLFGPGRLTFFNAFGIPFWVLVPSGCWEVTGKNGSAPCSQRSWKTTKRCSSKRRAPLPHPRSRSLRNWESLLQFSPNTFPTTISIWSLPAHTVMPGFSTYSWAARPWTSCLKSPATSCWRAGGVRRAFRRSALDPASTR